jgi:hypothetical protein
MTRSGDDLRCQFCGKQLTSERRLLSHKCKVKTRYLQRDDKAVRYCFTAYQKFYARSMRRRTPPDYDNFAKSTMYNEFVAFGKHIIALNAINPLTFIDFLLLAQVDLRDWTRQSVYQRYVIEMAKNEPPLEALERNLMLMQEWALQHPPAELRDFFRQIEPALAVLWIESGRISPWILLTANSTGELQKRLTPEQRAYIDQLVDGTFWSLKLQRHEAEVADMREVLEAYDI